MLCVLWYVFFCCLLSISASVVLCVLQALLPKQPEEVEDFAAPTRKANRHSVHLLVLVLVLVLALVLVLGHLGVVWSLPSHQRQIDTFGATSPAAAPATAAARRVSSSASGVSTSSAPSRSAASSSSVAVTLSGSGSASDFKHTAYSKTPSPNRHGRHPAFRFCS